MRKTVVKERITSLPSFSSSLVRQMKMKFWLTGMDRKNLLNSCGTLANVSNCPSIKGMILKFPDFF